MKHRLLLSFILVVWVLAASGLAQEKSDDQASIPQLVPKVFTKEESADQPKPAKEAKGAETAFPGLAEVVPRTAEVGQRAIRAEETIAALADVSSDGQEIAEAETRVSQLATRIAEMGDPAAWNIYRLLEIQQLLGNEKSKIGTFLDTISMRLAELETLGKRWDEEQVFWKKWEESLRAVQTEVPQDTFLQVRETTNKVMRAAANVSMPLLALQQKLTKLLDEIRQLSLPVYAALKKVRSETFQKNTPFFFSVEFCNQFDRTLWAGMKEGLAEAWKMEREYLPNYGWMLFLQVLATLTLISLLERRRQSPEKTVEWLFVRHHPWAFAIFTVQALALLVIPGLAPSWMLLNLALVIFSSAFLICSMFTQPRMRLVIFLLAGVLTLSLMLRLVSFPAPLYSLFHALTFVLGIWFFAREARLHLAENDGKLDLISVGLRAGPLVLFIALLLLLAGYSNLANYLMRSSIATIFFVIIAFLLLHMGNGGIEVVLSQPAIAGLGLISRFGEAIQSRLKKLLKAVLLLFLFLALFQLWGVYPSFGEAWARIFEFRFAIGELTLSLGRILVAVFLIYLVVSGSWLIRAFLDGEVFPRQQLDRGASDAIKKLIHYSLLFVGLMMAISIIGLNLTSFAFLTGALGIGVGFGLQNIVNNFVSGLMLLFERPFKVGDMVVVDSETGTVRKIGLRSTLIETADRSELIVPNSQFISGKVTNWTRSSHIARIKIAVGVAYGTDVQLVLRLLKEAAEPDRRILREPVPTPFFVNFGESALEFELHAWIGDVKDFLSVRSRLCQEIAGRFQEAGIEMPYAQRDLHLRSVDKDVLERALDLLRKKGDTD